MRKKLFFVVAFCIATISAMATEFTAGINVDSRTRYQYVQGFGGFSPSPQWAYWLNDADMDKLFGKGDAQLGLNLLRIYMANNKNYWNAGVANAKRAKKYGAFVFASPWSPPASWKSNNSEVNGGSLLEEHYADWADFLNDYYLYMKGQGADIDAVSLQNEPDWNTSYQSCIWTGEQMAKFLRTQGSKIGCKIIAPESVHFTKNLHEAMLNDPEACEQLDILGGHFYGWDGSSYPLAEQKGKPVWMTEYLINERQEKEGKNINWKDDGFLFARSINDAMLANFSAWVHYSLKRYYGCIGDGQYGTVDNAITKRGWVLSQYAKFVAGTTRVRHILNDATGQLSSSAYITQTGDSIILMVINPTSDTYKTTVTLPFYTKGGRTVTTSAAFNATKIKLTLDETYTPTVTVKPQSVNTFIFRKTALRTDIPEEEQNVTTIFVDDYDMYGSSCIPKGWRSQSEAGIRAEGNYTLGPRIMSFSAEGAMQYAFYFRAANNANGYVSYGEEAANRLYLTPGKYTLTYTIEGWKATPKVVCAVQKTTGANVKTLSATPEGYVSEGGSDSRIINATDCTLDFDITTAANYVLRWSTPKTSAGYAEVLVGNIKLVRHDNATGIYSVDDNKGDNRGTAIYNLAGQRLNAPQKGINIINGKKVMY